MEGVTVIIPTYNSGDTIFKTIDSVLAQVGVKVFIIVVDDCSSDNTLSLVRAKYENESIRIIESMKNKGPSAARNAALELVNTTWVAVVDSDDMISQNRLKLLIEIAVKENSDISVDQYYMCREADFKPYAIRGNLFCSEKPMLSLIESNFGSCKPVFRYKSTFANFKYDESLRYGEDLEILMRLLNSGAKISFIKKPLYFKRRSTNSLTGQRSSMLPEIVKLYKFILRKSYFSNEKDVRKLKEITTYLEDAYYFHILKDNFFNEKKSLSISDLNARKVWRALKHLCLRKKRFSRYEL